MRRKGNAKDTGNNDKKIRREKYEALVRTSEAGKMVVEWYGVKKIKKQGGNQGRSKCESKE